MFTHAIPRSVELYSVSVYVCCCEPGRVMCDQLFLWGVHLEGTFYFATLPNVTLLCRYCCVRTRDCSLSALIISDSFTVQFLTLK
jgi:hypothetical protein